MKSRRTPAGQTEARRAGAAGRTLPLDDGPNFNIRSGAVGTITGLFSYYGATPRNGRLGLRIDF